MEVWILRKVLSTVASLGLAAGFLVGCVSQPEIVESGIVVGWGAGGPLPTDVQAISTDFLHSLALKKDGTVVGWGNNENGQTSVPANLSNVTAIAASRFSSLALVDGGL
jgi:alpha-tubulin suppressor-like RCC1 family protein